jgi:hypothetical protein
VAAPGEVSYSASKHAAMAFTLGTLFDLRRGGHRGIAALAVCPDGIWTPMLADKLDDPRRRGSFSGRAADRRAGGDAVGKLTERPAPLLVLPRWRGPLLRLFDLFPRLGLRLLPLVMARCAPTPAALQEADRAGSGPEPTRVRRLAEDADHAADHAASAADRLHRLVLRLEPDVVRLAEEALHGRLFADQGDDDFAVRSASSTGRTMT